MSSVKISKKASDRLVAGLKRYQPILGKLRERDISEADTVTVIKDMLTDVFGYDKYAELTSEQQIRGTSAISRSAWTARSTISRR